MSRLGGKEWFTIGFGWLYVLMLIMAYRQPNLWNEKTFCMLITACLVTGLLNLAGGSYFTTGRTDDAHAANLGKALDALAAQAPAATGKEDDPVNVEVK